MSGTHFWSWLFIDAVLSFGIIALLASRAGKAFLPIHQIPAFS
jgi:hypothetical protein